MLFRFLKLLVTIGIRLYYREIKLVGKQHLPEDGPCIYIANHPNTLMDAWIVGYVSKMPLYFMAKGTLFSSPIKNRLLRSLNMIPINRKADGATARVSNKDSFEACYSLLAEKKCVVIFPEGTSFQERKLRELKSGTARIALETLLRHPNLTDVKIIPLGLNYMDPDKFRSKVLVHIGQAISCSPFLEEYQSNQGIAAKKLTEVFRIRLEQVLVNSTDKENEVLVDTLVELFQSKYKKTDHKGVEADLELMKKIRDAIDVLTLTQAWKLDLIKSNVTLLKQQLTATEIRADFLDRRIRLKLFLRQLVFSLILLLVGLPIFAWGFIHNVVIYKLTDFLIPKITKDIEYYAPISVLLGLLLYPIQYSLVLIVVNSYVELSTFWKVCYFVSMPVSGLLAYSLVAYVKHVKMKWKFMSFIVSNRTKLEELKKLKEKIYADLFGV